MVDRREDILWAKPHPTPTSVTIGGAKDAMDEYMRESVLEAFEYVAKQTTGHSVDKEGKVFFKFNGDWITTEQLFENFL